MTTDRNRLGRYAFIALTAIAAATMIRPAHAQKQPTGKDAAESRIAVVTTAEVFVRSNPADSYYPFGKLKKGDIVEVIGERYKFARVLTRGPAFEGFFGYIRYPKDGKAPLTLHGPDGGTRGRTVGKTDVLAPNLNTNYKPSDSWKRILSLPAGAEVRVLETLQTERNTVHKIVLPERAEGWISMSALADGGPDHLVRWNRAMGITPKAANETATASREKTTSTANAAVATAVTAPPRPTADRTPDVKVDRPDPAGSARTTYERQADVAERGSVKPDSVKPGSANAGATKPVLGREEPEITPIATPTVRTGTSDATSTQRDMTANPAATQQTVPANDAKPSPVERTEIETAPATPAKPTAPRTITERLEHLEATYQRLRDEPIHTAEVLPLRDLYRHLAAESNDRDVLHVSGIRAEQLTIWADLQSRRRELNRLRYSISTDATEAESLRRAAVASGAYAAVGRLVASTIYDGGRLPRLYRIQEVESGRAIAYIRPDANFDLGSMLGQVVGIVGTTQRDGSLHVKLIEPIRVDLVDATSVSARN